MLEFVNFGLYFVQVEDNFINPLLQVGSGAGSGEYSTESGSGRPKVNGSDRIRILIPAFMFLSDKREAGRYSGVLIPARV